MRLVIFVLLIFAFQSKAMETSASYEETGAVAAHKRKIDSLDSVEDSVRADTVKPSGKKDGLLFLQKAKENRSKYTVDIYDPTYFSWALESQYDIASKDINHRDPPHIEFLISPTMSHSRAWNFNWDLDMNSMVCSSIIVGNTIA